MTKIKTNISRRERVKKAAQAGLAAALLPVTGFGNNIQSKKRGIIIEENEKSGSSDWQLTRIRPDENGQRTAYIEGYCSR